MTVSELLWRGCYLGSSVSYNLTKLTSAGYILQSKSQHDRRVVMVKNTEKALSVCRILGNVDHQRQADFARLGLSSESIVSCMETLRLLQQYWAGLTDLAHSDQRREVAA